MGIKEIFKQSLFLFLSIAPLVNQRAQGANVNWSSIYKEYVNSIPLIYSKGVCSGALIGSDLVLTSWHCVSDVRPAKIVWKSSLSKYTFADVVAYDKKSDLVLLQTRSQFGFKLFEVIQNSENLQEGSPVATIGHPFATPNLFSSQTNETYSHIMSSGIISKVNSEELVSDISVSPGNSGGPVLDENSKIIGVTSRKVMAPGAGHISLLSKSNQIQDLIKKYQEGKKSGNKALRGLHADSQFILRAVYNKFQFSDQFNPDSSMWGLEGNLHLWSRLRLGYGYNFSITDRIDYFRLGWVQSYYLGLTRSLDVDVSYGKTSFDFESYPGSSSETISLGLDLMGLRLEIGQLLDFDKDNKFFIIGFNFASLF